MTGRSLGTVQRGQLEPTFHGVIAFLILAVLVVAALWAFSLTGPSHASPPSGPTPAPAGCQGYMAGC